MNQTSSKNRKIQILRAIAIFNVVIGHTCPYGVSGVLVRAVINFCVPLFFFLSGQCLPQCPYGCCGSYLYIRKFQRMLLLLLSQ